MSAIRNVLLWIFFGALAGVWTGALVAHQFVPWFNTPGSGIVAQCECHQLSVDTVNRTLTYELVGMIAGAAGFLVIGLVLGAGRGRKREPPAPSPSPAT